MSESSHQGTLSMLQQDLQGHMIGTDEKISKLQEQIERLIVGLSKRIIRKMFLLELREEACLRILNMLLLRDKGCFITISRWRMNRG